MKFPHSRLSSIGIILSALAPATITATGANAATMHGCPPGDVCIYPGAGWNNDQPSTIYYGHGCYAFSNQYGTHRILNNGYAPLYGYKGAICATDPVLTIAPGGWADADLTLVDSIKIA